jgi:flagellar biosynthesis/type III secretory pathway protein FliH
LVAGDDLPAGAVRRYGSDADAERHDQVVEHALSQPVRAVELDSIDIFEFAPLLVLLAAQEEAQAVIRQAHDDAVALREQARRDAFADARAESQRELGPVLDACAEAERALRGLEARLIAAQGPQLVDLAVEIAGRIVEQAVAADPAVAAAILERAQREVTVAKQVRVWLNPADWQALQQLRPELCKSASTSGRSIEFLSSEEIARGGCLLETEAGVVDATIPTQLAEVRRQLLGDDLEPAVARDL